MSKKLPLFVGAVWLIAAIALYGYVIWDSRPDGVYTYENDGCTTGQTVYVTDNDGENGYIYRMDLYGKVEAFFTSAQVGKHLSVCEVAYRDGLYTVLQEQREDDAVAYRIVALDEKMKPVRMTPEILLYETDRLSEFGMDDSGMYLTAVATDGTTASVYLLADELLTENGMEHEALSVESFLRKECEAGRVYVDAAYADGMVSVRTDADLVSGAFAVDDSLRYIYSQCRMSVTQLMQYHPSYAGILVAGIIVGWLVIFLLYVLLQNRNRFVYTAAILELMLGVVIFGGTAAVCHGENRAQSDASRQWLQYVLSDVVTDSQSGLQHVADTDFYDSDEYDGLCERLDYAKATLASEGCTDVFFADTEEYRIAVSADRRSQETVTERYFGAQDEQAADSLIRQGKTVYHSFTYSGEPKLLMVQTPEYSYGSGGMALFAVFSESGSGADWQGRLMYALLIFVLASMAVLVVIWLQAVDLDRLAGSMQLVAKGRTDLSHPSAYGRDMRALWSALGEIQKKIRSVNYEKYMTFEAYYRFAPKNIEKLLNKKSITEVDSGNVVRLSGTMAMISTLGAKSGSAQEIGRLNRLLAQIGRYQEEKDGVFISNDGALSMLRFLFMEKNSNTVSGAAGFLKELEDGGDGAYRSMIRTSMLLHYSSFVYGIAGTSQQSSAFLVSQDTEEIEHFAAWFREHGLKLVISETVRERESYDGALRCIGYIELADSGKKMNMYEVLDVYSAGERARKIELSGRFAQALQLFYQHDFYLARSAFSDVLKELPTDEIAKWYLFTCESYLNMEHAEELPCGLRYES